MVTGRELLQSVQATLEKVAAQEPEELAAILARSETCRTIDHWRREWRAFAAKAPLKGLQALADALKNGSKELVQGSFFGGLDVCGFNETPTQSCAIGYVFWKANYGKRKAALLDMMEVGSCDQFIRFFDGNDLAGVRRQLLPEVNRSIALRTDQTENHGGNCHGRKRRPGEHLPAFGDTGVAAGAGTAQGGD